MVNKIKSLTKKSSSPAKTRWLGRGKKPRPLFKSLCFHLLGKCCKNMRKINEY